MKLIRTITYIQLILPIFAPKNKTRKIIGNYSSIFSPIIIGITARTSSTIPLPTIETIIDVTVDELCKIVVISNSKYNSNNRIF